MPKKARVAKKKRSSRRKAALFLVAICGISIVTGVLSFDELPSIIGDNAEFMILARALADGKGFRYANHPEARPATKYPPGFPALLAGWGKIFGLSIESMKVNVLVCFIIAAALTFLLGRRLIGDNLGAAAALLVATSSALLTYSSQVLSDVPYMLFSLLALYLLIAGRQKGLDLAIGLALCVWAYFVRTAGASLVLAAVIFMFLKGRRREAILLICGFAVVSGLWAYRNHSLTGEGSRYLQVLLTANPYDPDRGSVTFFGLVGRAWLNGTAYVGSLLPTNLLPSLIRPVRSFGEVPVTTLLSVLVMIIAVIGGYGLRKKATLVNLYLILYFMIYLGWPEVWRSERFMIPIAPIMAIYLFGGIDAIMKYFDVKGAIVAVACLVLALTNVVSLHRHVDRVKSYPPGFVRYHDAALWVAQNTRPESVVLCRKPFLFHIFSDRKTIAYPFTRDRDAMRKYLMNAKPDYIVIDNFGGPTSSTDVYLVPVLEEMIEFLEAVYATEEPVTNVLRFSTRRGSR